MTSVSWQNTPACSSLPKVPQVGEDVWQPCQVCQVTTEHVEVEVPVCTGCHNLHGENWIYTGFWPKQMRETTHRTGSRTKPDRVTWLKVTNTLWSGAFSYKAGTSEQCVTHYASKSAMSAFLLIAAGHCFSRKTLSSNTLNILQWRRSLTDTRRTAQLCCHRRQSLVQTR